MAARAEMLLAAIERLAPQMRRPAMVLGVAFIGYAPIVAYTDVAAMQEPDRGVVALASIVLGVAMVALAAGWPDRYEIPTLVVGGVGVVVGLLAVFTDITGYYGSDRTMLAFGCLMLSIVVVATSRSDPEVNPIRPAMLGLVVVVSTVLAVPHRQWWTWPDVGAWTVGHTVSTTAAVLIAATAVPLLQTALIGPDHFARRRASPPAHERGPLSE